MATVDGYSLTGCDIISPHDVLENASLSVSDGKIAGISPLRSKVVDLRHEYFLYPALINIHDHLRGNYLPKVGPKPGSFYVNWAPWDADLKSSPTYGERSHLSVEQMYFLGAYKNLFSGVVTVSDHFPHEFNEPYIDRLPIRVLRNYTLAHECSSYDLKWGDGIELEHARAVERNWPFITHLEEGFDPESQDGIGILERAHCLNEHDVLIHCIGFSDEDILKTKASGASVSWCPASNIFMFNVTCKIRKMLKAGINVGIGTDSTHTGSVNLLEEMRFARETYRSMYGTDLKAKAIMAMVTENPAKALRIDRETGKLEPGLRADLLLLKARKDDPHENLLDASLEDIALLVMDGIPLYGETKFADLLPENAAGYSEIVVGGRTMFVRGDPEKLMAEVHKAVGFEKKLDYIPFQVKKTLEGVR